MIEQIEQIIKSQDRKTASNEELFIALILCQIMAIHFSGNVEYLERLSGCATDLTMKAIYGESAA
jgi:L-cysteine desulfidase